MLNKKAEINFFQDFQTIILAKKQKRDEKKKKK